MKLSIIVPVYNMEAGGKLNYCLDSLIAQTVRDKEIIAVDDFSTDGSLGILREYEEKYPEMIKVIASSENHRQGGAKNRGLDAAGGEYIGFVDSDDWVLPDMYERLIEACERENSDIAACMLAYASEHTMNIGPAQPGIDTTASGKMNAENFRKLIRNFGTLVTKVYRRAIFEEPALRFPEHMFYEDNALAVEIAHRAGKISIINEAMYFYYQDPASTTHIVSESRCRDRMQAMRIMIELAKEGGYLEDYLDEFEFRFANLFYRNTLFTYMQGKKTSKAFVSELGNEMKQTFPDFQSNEQFTKTVPEEERKLIAMQQKSTLKFMIYYKLLWTYRHIRYGK